MKLLDETTAKLFNSLFNEAVEELISKMADKTINESTAYIDKRLKEIRENIDRFAVHLSWLTDDILGRAAFVYCIVFSEANIFWESICENMEFVFLL